MPLLLSCSALLGECATCWRRFMVIVHTRQFALEHGDPDDVETIKSSCPHCLHDVITWQWGHLSGAFTDDKEYRNGSSS